MMPIFIVSFVAFVGVGPLGVWACYSRRQVTKEPLGKSTKSNIVVFRVAQSRSDPSLLTDMAKLARSTIKEVVNGFAGGAH